MRLHCLLTMLAAAFVATITITVTLVAASGGFYTATDPTFEIQGWSTKLQYIENVNFPGNSSRAYRHLKATVHNTLRDTDFRLRITPDPLYPLRPDQEMPFQVPSEVVWFADGQPSNVPAFDPTQVSWEPSVDTTAGGIGDIFVTNKNHDSSSTYVDAPLSVRDLRFEEFRVRFRMEVKSTVRLFGFGQHNVPFCLTCDDSQLPMKLANWNTDEPGLPRGGKPLYGTHPVLYLFDPDLLEFRVMAFVSSQPQRLIIGKSNAAAEGAAAAGGSTRSLNFTFVGGILDVIVMQRKSAIEAVQAYNMLIHPSFDKDAAMRHSPYGSGDNIEPQPIAVPPYWALGVSQSRWGWSTIWDVAAVVDGYNKANLPLDNLLCDIDVMQEIYRIFTFDPVRFPPSEVAPFVANLSKYQKKHFSTIVDPGVGVDTTFPAFQKLVAQKAFVSQPGNDKDPAIGVVWPGWTSFVSHASAAGEALWIELMTEYLEQVPGIAMSWIDMNEISSFGNGNCPLHQISNSSSIGVNWATLNWNDLPSIIGPFCPGPDPNVSENFAVNFGGNGDDDDSADNNNDWLGNGYRGLYTRTLDMGSLDNGRKYFNSKNFYAWYESRATYRGWLKNQPGKRPMILSRASFLGSAKWASIWQGDNMATFQGEGGLFDSIQLSLTAQTYGIVFTGSDVGGFSNPTTAELMQRWVGLAALCYPWFRAHHGNRDPAQELFRYPPATLDAMRYSLRLRYALAPFSFSNVVAASRYGTPLVSHPAFVFPSEMNALLANDPSTGQPRTAMMMGDAILVVPVAIEGQQTVNVRFPSAGGAQWFNLHNGGALVAVGPAFAPYYPATLSDPVPAFVRSGRILPLHSNVSHNSLEYAREYAVNLACFVGAAPGSATGFAFFDDGADSLITGAGTFARLDYVSTVAAGAVFGSVTSVLRSEPPASMRFRSFKGPAMLIDVIFTLPTANDGNAPAVPAVKYCLVNGTFACRLVKTTSTVGKELAIGFTTFVYTFEINGAPLDATMPWQLQWSSEPLPSSPTNAPPTNAPAPTPETTKPGNNSNSSNGNSSSNGNNDSAAEEDNHFDRALLGVCIVLGIFLVGAIIYIAYIKGKAKNDDQFYTQLDSITS